MITAVLALILTALLARLLVQSKAAELRHSMGLLQGVFWYHLLFCGVYYAYAYTNASDSHAYYNKISGFYRGEAWDHFYGVGTRFIEFLGYPFVQYFGFSYEAIMILFAFFGFVGIFYFYLFVIKFMQYRHKFFGIDFIALLLFLPNMHFWSVSLGKGSVILMGLGMLFYGLLDFRRHWIPLALGALVVFHVRAHVMLVILLGMLLSVLFSSKGIKTWQKGLIVCVGLLALAPVANTFLDYAKIEETDTQTLTSFVEHRGSELGKATSSVDVNNYSQPVKLFTFLFRPLFIDAPNALGLIVSFENTLYLLLFLKMLSLRFIRFIIGAHWMVKLSLIVFLGVSLALAQVSGNMGLAIRQKSQVMYLFFFVLLAYADYAYRTKGQVVLGE